MWFKKYNQNNSVDLFKIDLLYSDRMIIEEYKDVSNETADKFLSKMFFLQII